MITTDNAQLSKEWWKARRWQYNKGLIRSGAIAFLLYAILGSILIAPHDEGFEITLFTTFFQGIGYLIMMGIANLFYNLGHLVDRKTNLTVSEHYRERLFKAGYYFSISLPYLIPLLVVVSYLIRFA